jgi:hypothetical protein
VAAKRYGAGNCEGNYWRRSVLVKSLVTNERLQRGRRRWRGR